MHRDKGVKRAALVPEAHLQEKLSGTPTIDRTSQSRIGDHLRAMYDGLMQQPVPDRFVDLINRLDQRENGEGHGTR